MSDAETESYSEEQADQNDEAEWDEWNESDGADEEATRSLFDDAVLPSVEAAIDHDAKAHGFDIREYRKRVRRDCPAAARRRRLAAAVPARRWAAAPFLSTARSPGAAPRRQTAPPVARR
jgi:hypothetical protein